MTLTLIDGLELDVNPEEVSYVAEAPKVDGKDTCYVVLDWEVTTSRALRSVRAVIGVNELAEALGFNEQW